jgi:hypothetical protein
MIPLHRVAAVVAAASGLVLAGAGARTVPQAGKGDAEQRATTGGAQPAASCPVKGVWDIVSVSMDGKDQPLAGYTQRKILTARHYMWLGQAAKRDTLPLRTEADTLRAYQTPGGAGTYTTTDSTYTERLDYFVVPSLVGTSVTAKCRVDGDRWTHSFTDPFDTTAARGPVHRIVEVWRRVE